MATNIPPHNLGELVDALSVLIHNPDVTVFVLFSDNNFFSFNVTIMLSDILPFLLCIFSIFVYLICIAWCSSLQKGNFNF